MKFLLTAFMLYFSVCLFVCLFLFVFPFVYLLVSSIVFLWFLYVVFGVKVADDCSGPCLLQVLLMLAGLSSYGRIR